MMQVNAKAFLDLMTTRVLESDVAAVLLAGDWLLVLQKTFLLAKRQEFGDSVRAPDVFGEYDSEALWAFFKTENGSMVLCPAKQIQAIMLAH